MQAGLAESDLGAGSGTKQVTNVGGGGLTTPHAYTYVLLVWTYMYSAECVVRVLQTGQQLCVKHQITCEQSTKLANPRYHFSESDFAFHISSYHY